MRLIRKAAAVLLCLCAVVSCCACGEKEEISPENHLFKYAIAAEPTSLDPQAATGDDAREVIQNLFEGLVRLDENGGATPGAAQSWSANAENTQFTFVLREGLVWSDGTPLTADDFVYAVRRALDSMTGCPQAEELYCIQGAEDYHRGLIDSDALGVEAPDKRTVRFTLTGAFEAFPAETAKNAYLPCSETFFASTGGTYGMESEALLTNGPFRLRDKNGWVHGDYLRLVRNEHYVGAQAAVPSGVQFAIGKPADGVQAVLDTTVHVAEISSAQVKTAKDAGLQVKSFTETTWGMLFNCKNTSFSNAQVRLALVCAVSRAELPAYYPEQTTPTVNLIPGGITVLGKPYRVLARGCALPRTEEQTPAQQLAQGLAELGQTKLGAMTVLCVDTPQNRLLVNQLLSDWRSALGYYLNIETVADEAALNKRIAAGNYQIALTGVHASENSPGAYIRAVAGLAGYASEEYNALTAQLHEAPVDAARKLEDLLIGTGVFYPMYALDSAYALGATVTNLLIRPFGGGIDFRAAGRTA